VPGGRGKQRKPVYGSNEEVFRFRRPASVPEWMAAPEDGCAEFLGLRREWPDLQGRPRIWYTTLVYFDVYLKDYRIKRYAPDDYDSFVKDMRSLPTPITFEMMEQRGFRLE